MVRQCDFLVHEVTLTPLRLKMSDYTLPWAYDQFAFIIPIADESANINAVVKPFQWPVWLGLGVSIVCVIEVLTLMLRYLDYQSTLITIGNKPREDSDISVNLQNVRRDVNVASKEYLYVFGNLLSQGGTCTSKRLPFRTVAGVWTLAAFIFVQAYTSTLFTYVVTPIHHPLINSVYDIADRTDINLLVREAGFINTLLLTANETGLYMKLRDRLNSFDKSVCPVVSECIRLVTPGSRNVYVDAKSYLKDVIRTELKKTGKCNLQLAKEGFLSIAASFALPKNSPYTQTITQGILEMQQIGLIDHWDSWFRPMPPQCTGKPQIENKATGNKLTRLNMKNLTGAFIVLLVGLSLSLLAFLCEIIISKLGQRRRMQLQVESSRVINVTEHQEPTLILLN
ncbi:hypothetical protein DAPPUDRAFT_316861 [Daphnia pulex]|uniref:Ionotropic glutamate receptor C-terminal domain-containing protein n=1 Tax=Daphnia pulex TaxID=6669 RepID=E9GE74_DAPPU|nr:hypothetical protein DAPPUDRAFT_316861 [Daphnia pulex]|eukprot:EFX82216.1 hypothetical protein DAPPUDRAFT_316861 [Daphnia pulex]